MQAEDPKTWLKGVEREEKAANEGKEGHEGVVDLCRLFVWFIQHIWKTREIARQTLLST